MFMRMKLRPVALVCLFLNIVVAAGCSARKPVALTMTLNPTEIQPVEVSDQPIVARLNAHAQNLRPKGRSAITKYSPNHLGHEDLMLTVTGIPDQQRQLGKVDLKFDVIRDLFIYVATETHQSAIPSESPEAARLNIICRFDSHLSIDDNIASALFMYGAPVNGSYGLKKRSLISQLSPTIHIALGASGEAIAEACTEKYITDLRTKTLEIMTRFSENIYYNLPKHRCGLPRSPGMNSGDDTCLEWFQHLYPELKRSTVPRCQETEDASTATGFCVIRSKYMSACPIFLDQDLNYGENPDDGSIQLASNPTNKQFFCDSDRRQRCRARKNAKDDSFAVSGTCDVP